MAGFLAGLVKRIGASAVSTIGSPLLTAASREATYVSNRWGPTATPEKDALMHLWWTGRSSEGGLIRSFENQGVAWNPNRRVTGIAPSQWADLVELERPMWDLEFYRKLRRQGRIDGAQFADALARAGFYSNINGSSGSRDQRRNIELFAEDWDGLSLDAILALWNRDAIDRPTAEYYLHVIGFTRQEERNLLLGLATPFDFTQAAMLTNRGVLSPVGFDYYLKRLGYNNQSERDNLASLRFQIPGPSDLVLFALREVFSPSVSAQMGFDSEMPQDFRTWLDKQGMGMPFEVTDPVTGVKENITWADAYWRAHWQWPSATMGYEMLHRFRPTGGANNGPRSPTGLVFQSTDLNLMLRALDYPPHWRPYLEALSYRPVPAVRLRQARQHGLIDNAELAERYQDTGYTRPDAQLMANAVDAQINIIHWNKEISGHKGRVLTAYKAGTMSRQDAAIQVYLATLNDISEVNSFRALDRAAQIARASQEAGVTLTLDGVDADFEAKIANTSVAAVRAAFIRLDIDANRARMLLTNLGITITRINQHIRLWQFQLMGKGKTWSAGEVLKYVTKGAIPPASAVARLRSLGYQLADAQTMVGVAMQDLASAQARMRVQMARGLQQQQQAQKSMIKQQLADLKRSQADLAKHGTPAKLAAWVTADPALISRAEYDMRMAAMGWPMIDAARLAQEAHDKKKK